MPRRNNTLMAWRGTALGFVLGVAACASVVLLYLGPRSAELMLRAAAAAAARTAAAASAPWAPPPPPPAPSPAAAAAAAPCAASGLCSLGRVRPWSGDLLPSPEFRAALRARAYKREVVLLCTDGRSLDFTLQPVAQMARLGMAHHLLLADGPGTCERARRASPLVGCGWYGDGNDQKASSSPSPSSPSSPDLPLLPPRVQGAFRLWALRMRTALRALRLGVNVLVLDADTVLFADPYPYLKHPALLGKFHWIAQPESGGGDEEGGGGYLNGGVYYIQNAAPDGAAAFLMYEAVRRMLRWEDDGRVTLRSIALPVGGAAAGGGARRPGAVSADLPVCCDADQDLLNDAFRTMRTGTLTSSCALRCALDQLDRADAAAAAAAAAPLPQNASSASEAAAARLKHQAETSAARKTLSAALARVEDAEAGCGEYWATEDLSDAPRWSWPVVYGPASAAFPDAAAVVADSSQEEEMERGEQEGTHKGGGDGGINGTRTVIGTSKGASSSALRIDPAEAARRAHYARRALEDPARVRWGPLRVMNARGFDARLGGRFYPRKRWGRYSRALDAQLRADCPRCGMWPDPEDAASAAAADALPRERLAIMPPWLLTSWQAHGWRGYWGASPLAGAPGRRGGGNASFAADALLPSSPENDGPLERLVQSSLPLFPAPSQLLGHVWFVPEATASLKTVKRVAQMAAGAYDWPLALSALGSGAFGACRDMADLPLGFNNAGSRAPIKCGGPGGLRVLALHPDAERGLLSGAASWDEYASVAAGLADAAAALGRVPAWPSVDCAAAAALGEYGIVVKDPSAAARHPFTTTTAADANGRRRRQRRRTAPYGGLSPRVAVDHRGRCFPWFMAVPACMSAGKGLLPWELDAWLAYRAPAIAALSASLSATGGGGGGGGNGSADDAWTGEPREGVNVIRLRVEPTDGEQETRRLQQKTEDEEREEEDDDGDDDDDDASSTSSSPDDPASAPPAPVPGWRVPLLLVDAARLQEAAAGMPGADRGGAPVLYLSAPVALEPGTLTDDNDALAGRARLAGTRRDCFPLVPGSLAELRRNELRGRAAEAAVRADEEAAKAVEAAAAAGARGVGSAEDERKERRRREAELRREAARLEAEAKDEDATHYLLHDLADASRKAGLLSWAAKGLWRGVPTLPAPGGEDDAPAR